MQLCTFTDPLNEQKAYVTGALDGNVIVSVLYYLRFFGAERFWLKHCKHYDIILMQTVTFC